MSMPAVAAPVEFIVLCAALDPKNISLSRPVSRQSRLRTLVFPAKKVGFAMEGVEFELSRPGVRPVARSHQLLAQ
jgi:hypothetical protein